MKYEKSGLPRKKCTPKRASSDRADHKTVQTRHDKTWSRFAPLQKRMIAEHWTAATSYGRVNSRHELKDSRSGSVTTYHFNSYVLQFVPLYQYLQSCETYLRGELKAIFNNALLKYLKWSLFLLASGKPRTVIPNDLFLAGREALGISKISDINCFTKSTEISQNVERKVLSDGFGLRHLPITRFCSYVWD